MLFVLLEANVCAVNFELQVSVRTSQELRHACLHAGFFIAAKNKQRDRIVPAEAMAPENITRRGR